MPIIKYESEAEWLEGRSGDLTSTEVASLFGISPHRSRYKLWMEKAVKVSGYVEDNQHMRWGRRLQLPIAAGISADNNWSCLDLTLYYLKHPTLKLGASMDHKVICDKLGAGLMEIKSTGYFQEEKGWTKESAPLEYEVQLQTQLHLARINGSPFDFGVIAALDGRKNTRIYFIDYDPAFGEALERETAAFWKSIEENCPPEPDYVTDEEIIHSLIPKPRAGEGKNLSENPEAVRIMQEWQGYENRLARIKPRIKALEDGKTACKNKILTMIGNAQFVTIGKIQINTTETETEDTIRYSTKTRRFSVRKLK